MSGRKNNLLKFQTVINGSMAGSLTSAVTNIEFLDNIGIQAIWSSGSTPVGTLQVEISIDYAQDTFGNVTNPGTWTSLTTTASVSGNTGNVYFDINQISSPWIRLTYVRASGSGTLNAYVTGKMI